MSKVLNLNIRAVIQTNNEKINILLLNEIIFFTRCCKDAQYEREKRLFKFALAKFNFLSNVVYKRNSDLTNKDYGRFLSDIYQTIEDVYNLL